MKKMSSDQERSIFYPGETDLNENSQDQQDEELDLLPEFCHYRDEGCELAPACLECPFPDCVYEQYRGNLAQARYIRDREMVRLHTKERVRVSELCARFNVCARTVRRALKSRRNEDE